jgi:ribosome-binding ATPase YchF (GTP1/OBG family)
MGYVRTQCVCKEFSVEDNPVNSLCLDGVRLIPVELVDTAGLVPDAWQGRGLGNQFLDEIMRADALIHVVDASGSTDLEGRVLKPGTHDPSEDVRFLEREMTMWFAQILKRDWQRIARTVDSGSTDLQSLLEERLSGLSVEKRNITEALRKTGLNADKPTRWSDEDFIGFVNALREVSKPMLIAANKVDIPAAEENIERLKESGYVIIPCSAEAELILRRAAEKGLVGYRPGDPDFELQEPTKMTEKQKNALKIIREKVVRRYNATGVQEAINAAFFKILNLIVVYTVEDVERLSDHNGKVLPDARLVPRGTTAKELAYKIHTELGESFIHAIDARSRRRRGEDYVLEDRDIISVVSAKKRK